MKIDFMAGLEAPKEAAQQPEIPTPRGVGPGKGLPSAYEPMDPSVAVRRLELVCDGIDKLAKEVDYYRPSGQTIETGEGMRAQLRTAVNALDKAHKEITAPHTAWKRKVDSTRKKLKDRLLDLIRQLDTKNNKFYRDQELLAAKQAKQQNLPLPANGRTTKFGSVKPEKKPQIYIEHLDDVLDNERFRKDKGAELEALATRWVSEQVRAGGASVKIKGVRITMETVMTRRTKPIGG
jgi:hypothetical protein